MKAALSAVAVAAVLAFAPLAGATFAAADDFAQQRSRFSPEDRAAFLDARIAALKAPLSRFTTASTTARSVASPSFSTARWAAAIGATGAARMRVP